MSCGTLRHDKYWSPDNAFGDRNLICSCQVPDFGRRRRNSSQRAGVSMRLTCVATISTHPRSGPRFASGVSS